MYKPQTFLGIEDAMLKPVSTAGTVVARGIERKVRSAFENKGADVADQIMLEADFASLGKVVERELPLIMRAALIFGAAQVTGSFKNTSITQNRAVDDVVATVTDLHTKIVTDAAKKFIYTNVSNILADFDMEDLGDGIEKAERIRKTDLADQLNQAVNGGVQLMAGISANLTTSRLVTYGFLFEAKLKGVAQYQLEAVLDDRTSEVCKRLHGRVFQVEQAFSYTDQVLRTTEPDALKAIAPFLKSNKAALADLENMTDEELQSRGVMVPPFHPGCRTMLVMLGHSHEETVDYTPVEFDEPQTKEITPVVAAQEVYYSLRDKYTKAKIAEMGAAHVTLPNYVSESENKALSDYVDSLGYEYLNENLRAGKPLPSQKLQDLNDGLLEVMTPLAAPATVYRGIPTMMYLELGDVVEMGGFLSTSSDPGGAFGFAKKKIVFAIKLKGGEKVVATNAFEMEYILPPGQKFRVISIDEDVAIDDDYRKLVKAAIVYTVEPV